MKASVLIAEDHPDTREALRLLLELGGFDVIAAEDGVTAWLLLAEHVPDVIVADLMMPKLGGIELIRRVRRRLEWAQIPIVAISAYANVYLMQAHRCGATVVLRKPDDFGKLVETIDGLIGH